MLPFLTRLFQRPLPSDGPTQPTVSSQNTLDEIPQYKGMADKKHWAKIRFAFTSGGKNYFCWSADVNITYERMMAAQEVYREIEWRLTPTLIRSAFAKISKLVFDSKAKPEFKLEEISKISALTMERIDLAFSPSLDLKMASIVYFDEYENPFDYDYDYAKNKISHWVKSGDIPSFFLTMPNARLLPGGAELNKVSKDFLEKMEMELTLTQLVTNLVMADPSSLNLSKDSEKIIALHRELDSTLLELSNSQPTNTI